MKEAVKWFQKAAEQNYPEAQDALGEMTQAGQGTKRDLNEAIGFIGWRRTKETWLANMTWPIFTSKASEWKKTKSKRHTGINWQPKEVIRWPNMTLASDTCWEWG